MPLSLEQLCTQLVDSGLVTADQLHDFQKQHSPADAEQLARLLVKHKLLTSYQAQQAYAGKAKSLTLGNYVLLEKLGQGGMGMVLKAQHRRMKRLVALKVLSPTVAKSPELIARFHREVEAAAKLSHPNIVAAFDADEANGTSFLVMEFVDGKDLASAVKSNGPFSLAQACSCILQAARGLQYAHQQHVIHRDIKPANLLIDQQGVVKILDMGLARIDNDDGKTDLTSTGAVMGTVDYMAPEQALSTKHADARSDIYSLGISLWYLLTGKTAYDGDSMMARLLRHRDAAIPSLVEALTQRKSGKTVPPEQATAIDAIFQTMVAKKPEDRYQSMADVIQALESLQAGDVSVVNLQSAAAVLVEPTRSTPAISAVSGTAVRHPTRAAQEAGTATVASPPDNEPLATASPASATVVTGDEAVATDISPATQTAARRLPKKAGKPTKTNRKPPGKTGNRMLLFAGGGFVALLLGVIVITITNKDGTTTRIEVPDSSNVEVTKKPESPGQSESSTKATPTSPKPLESPQPDPGEVLARINLIDTLDLKLDCVKAGNLTDKNEWTITDGVLRYRPDGKAGKVRFPISMNKVEAYTIEFDVRRSAGKYNFTLNLPITESLQGGLDLVPSEKISIGPQGGSRTTIGQWPMMPDDTDEAHLKVDFDPLPDGNGTVVVSINGTEAARWEGPLNSIGRPIEYYAAFPGERLLSLLSFRAIYEFRNMTLQVRRGTAVNLRPNSPSEIKKGAAGTTSAAKESR